MPKEITASDFADLRGLTLIGAHKHLRKKWMPKPVRENPPRWDLEAVKRAERKHREVTDWLEGKGKQ